MLPLFAHLGKCVAGTHSDPLCEFLPHEITPSPNPYLTAKGRPKWLYHIKRGAIFAAKLEKQRTGKQCHMRTKSFN